MADLFFLIVEDEGIVAMDIEHSLRRLGYTNIEIASSGEAALDLIGKKKPELILMDILLKGGMDGVEAAGRIKELCDIPVIYMTAYADEHTLERAKITEPYGYILKPFEERELHTTIEMALYKHKMEMALRRNEEQYRRFFEEDITGDFICMPDGRLLACNPAFAQIFGFLSPTEALSVSMTSIFPDEKSYFDFVALLTESKKLDYYEGELRRIDGKPVYIVANIMGVFDENGGLTELRGYIFDDTRRKRLEEQFRQAQKMEAVGRLAGGVAHDFNNILTVINGYTDFILGSLNEKSPFMEELKEIKLAGERAAALTRQLLAFSRNQVLRPTVIDLNEVVKNIEKMLRRLIGENIELRTGLGKDLWLVEVDPGQIEQVIMNLAINARDAMRNGGKLFIETSNAEVDEAVSSQLLNFTPGRYVVLSISDTGEGMDEQTRQHLFEPFYTTKPKGEGTGLGLSTVYGIVAQSNGHINLYSEKGIGTTFKIYLPRVIKPGESASAKKKVRKLRTGSETILVVEDEIDVLNLISRILKNSGYTVLEARNGEEALEVAGKHQGTIHLILTDIVMPGLSGPETVQKFKQTHPSAHVIFMSGYSDKAIQHHFLMENEMVFLQKPFRPDELSNRIRELLDSRAYPALTCVSAGRRAAEKKQL
jgi:two-component system, cell cycle sensor histidine kinase and response regulator CckA